MNSKLLKILLNIIVVILCVGLLYFISVFSIFTFLGRRIGDNVDSQYIIVAIIIIALCILLLGIIVKCILMIMKILLFILLFYKNILSLQTYYGQI